MLNDKATEGVERININELNDCIEENIINMSPTTDYDFLEEISRIMLQRINVGNKIHIVPLVLFTREKAISIVLKFFDSLDNKEWYERAKDIILGQDKNIGINIFNSEDIDPLEIDEYGFYRYSDQSVLQYKVKGSKALIKILLKEEFEDVSEFIEKDKFTLEDIYSIVHEISHTFDLGDDEKSKEARKLFAEINPYCFERMLGNYLLNNNIINESVLEKMIQERIECSIRHARAVYSKISLVKLKEKEEILRKDNIKKMLEENNINNPLYVQAMFTDILSCNPNIDFQARYMIAELTAHQYMKSYREDKKGTIERLKKYCEEMKRGNSNDEVLTLVGCPVNSEQVLKIANDIRDNRNR